MWIALAALLLTAQPGAAPPCKGNPALAGKCFTVHGRFRAYNGNPTFRIWPVGTTRLIGVTGPKPGDQPIMPENLACGFYCDVFADFELCPFSESKPGIMQRACVESAANKILSHRE